jgi:hypothetical protein
MSTWKAGKPLQPILYCAPDSWDGQKAQQMLDAAGIQYSIVPVYTIAELCVGYSRYIDLPEIRNYIQTKVWPWPEVLNNESLAWKPLLNT